MGSTSSKREFLLSLDSRKFLRFTRRCEARWTMGYLLGVGSDFFLVALVSDHIRFDGFECTRIRDIRELQSRADGPGFPEKALRKRGLRTPKRPKVDLNSLAALLETAGKSFPVITIHREKVNPAVCHIGQVLDVGKKRLSLLEIDPDAVWEGKPTDYKLSEITRVAFGGDYEDALVLVGGKPHAA